MVGIHKPHHLIDPTLLPKRGGRTICPRNAPRPAFLVSRRCVIPLDKLSGLWQLVEEVVHGAEDLGFVGTEDVVIGVGQTDHLS